MVAAMATFEGTPTGPAVTARLAGKDLVPWLREYDGFRGVLVLTGEEKHGVITLWDTREEEASTRPARLAMHDSVSAAAGMSLVDYQVYDLPVLDIGCLHDNGAAAEVKWDGFRAIVSTEDDLRVRSRRGWDIGALGRRSRS